MACECASGGACAGPMAAGDLLRYQRRGTDMEMQETVRALHLRGHDREGVMTILGMNPFEYNRLTGR